MSEQIQAALTIIRRKEVESRVGLSRSSIYALIKANKFPKPIRLGDSLNPPVGWVEAEVVAWLTAQIEKSRKAA